MDSNTAIVLAIVGLIIVIAIHAYNMGWQSGHDVHHDDSIHNVPRDVPPPKGPPTLYQ